MFLTNITISLVVEKKIKLRQRLYRKKCLIKKIFFTFVFLIFNMHISMKIFDLKKLINIGISFVILCTISFSAFADETRLPEKDRYIVIDNYDEFFQESGNSIVIEKFYLKNIFEDESSKPLFVSINELSGVNQFYIKTSSDEIANQRACYLELKKEDYFRTFRMALFKMNVRFILYNGNLLTIDEFYSIKK